MGNKSDKERDKRRQAIIDAAVHERDYKTRQKEKLYRYRDM